MKTPGILQNLFSSGRTIVMDGGMGSTAAASGIDVQTAIWGSYGFLSETGRQLNDHIHRDFVKAGAQVLIANAHNTRRAKCQAFLDQIGLPMLPEEISSAPPDERLDVFHRWLHEQAMQSARSAVPAGADVIVATCLGSIEPLGPYANESQISAEEASNRLQVEVQVRQPAHADLLIFETLTTRSEIDGVAQLAAREEIGDFAVGLTCGPNGRTLAEVEMSEIVAMLRPVAPAVYFVQCTPYQYVRPGLESLASQLGPGEIAGVYANDGRLWKDRRWHGEPVSPERYAEEALLWQQMGARVIGGCCGIGPDHIVKLTQSLN